MKSGEIFSLKKKTRSKNRNKKDENQLSSPIKEKDSK